MLEQTKAIPEKSDPAGDIRALGHGYYLTADAAAETCIFKLEQAGTGVSERWVAFALRTTFARSF